MSMKLLRVFAIGATFLHSTELRNVAAQLSQDRTVPSFTVKKLFRVLIIHCLSND